jgi:hypothetical protein
MSHRAGRILEAVETLLRESARNEDWERVAGLATLWEGVRAHPSERARGEPASERFALVHREAGTIATFSTLREAEKVLAAVRGSGASWAHELRIKPLGVVAREP